MTNQVNDVILVLSGKGGVGKSSVSTQLALSLVAAGKKVGLLDIDLCGPSIPRMLNVCESNVMQSTEGWIPIPITDKNSSSSSESSQGSLSVMSIGFLLPNRDASVVWRGPKKSAMIRQFLTDVCWNSLDYLVIDTPPGTSDEHLAIIEQLEARWTGVKKSAVIVTTPQTVSLNDVRKEIQFCRVAELPILGLIENMSGYVCPHCKECSLIFSQGGGKSLAEEKEIPFLGSLPIDPSLTRWLEDPKRESLVREYSESNIYIEHFKEIASDIQAKADSL